LVVAFEVIIDSFIQCRSLSTTISAWFVFIEHLCRCWRQEPHSRYVAGEATEFPRIFGSSSASNTRGPVAVIAPRNLRFVAVVTHRVDLNGQLS
jgi:hypothetical protein